MPHDIKSCAAQHFGPWMIEPKWFTEAVSAVKAGTFKSEQVVERGPDGVPVYVWDVTDGVATIPISGQTQKGDSSFGGTSSVRVRNAIRQASKREDVTAILLHIDSPGGTVAGTAELANDVRNARDAGKYVHTHFSDLGASAAYWVGSQADYVTAEPTTLIGSIGVVAIVEDSSGMADKMGVKVHVISTGDHKGAFAPGREVTDEQLADLQRKVNDLNKHFLRGVAKGRDMAMDKVRDLATGQVWIADEAKKRGLVDAVASFDEVTALLTKRTFDMNKEQALAFIDENPDVIADRIEQAKSMGRSDGRGEVISEYEDKLEAAEGDHALAFGSVQDGTDIKAITKIVSDRKAQAEAIQAEATARAAAEQRAEEAEARVKALEALGSGQPPLSTGAGSSTPDYEGMSSKERAEAEWEANEKMADGRKPQDFKKDRYTAFRVQQLDKRD